MPALKSCTEKLIERKKAVDVGLRRNEPPVLSIQAGNLGGSYGRFVTPLHLNTYYFNPGLMDYEGKRYLVARKFWMDYDSWWDYRSVMSAMEIRHDMTLGPERIIEYRLRDQRESVEDPRCAIAFGRQAIACCAWIPPAQFNSKPKIVIHQSLFILGKDFKVDGILDVEYGGNGPSLYHGESAEKNWLWFDCDKRSYFVYQTEPHIVCEVVGGKVVQEHRTHAALGWTLGTIRGGTPPVRVGDHFISFFHSSMPWKSTPRYGVRRVYFMGAYMFEAKPPFQIVAATRERLLTGTWNEPTQEGVPAVVYPNGALIDGDTWTISMGVNDCGCGWVKLNHEDLMKRMTPC